MKNILLLCLLIFMSLTLQDKAYAREPVQFIHLIAHENIKDRQFLEDLECMLEAIYVLEVKIHKAHTLDFSSLPLNERAQHKGEHVLNILEHQEDLRALTQKGIVFYFISQDMYEMSYRKGAYLLGWMNYNTFMNAISLARLRHADNHITTNRLFRLVAKNTAKFLGHKPSGQCFMGYSKDIRTLDNREIRLCEPDLSALKKIGLIRADIKDGTVIKGCELLTSQSMIFNTL